MRAKYVVIRLLVAVTLVLSGCSDSIVRQMVTPDFQEMNGVTLTFHDHATSAQISLTCRPPDDDYCATDFQARCDEGGGGLSTEPDGGITCTLPDH